MNEKKVIVLVMHGRKPSDFPKEETTEYMTLRRSKSDLERLDELENKIRSWPRTEENDPYFYGSAKIGEELSGKLGLDVIVCFNEFCAPTVEEAIDQAVEASATEITVTTPMVTPGGHHAQEEIPEIIKESQEKYPSVPSSYAWPPKTEKVANFLAEVISEG